MKGDVSNRFPVSNKFFENPSCIAGLIEPFKKEWCSSHLRRDISFSVIFHVKQVLGAVLWKGLTACVCSMKGLYNICLYVNNIVRFIYQQLLCDVKNMDSILAVYCYFLIPAFYLKYHVKMTSAPSFRKM